MGYTKKAGLYTPSKFLWVNMREKLMRGKNCLLLGQMDLNTSWGFGRGRNCMSPLLSGKILSMFINTLKENAKATETGFFFQWAPVTFRSHLDMVLGNLHWMAFRTMRLGQVISMHPFHPQPFCDSLKSQQIPILPGSSNCNDGEPKEPQILFFWFGMCL